jgi:hypothetical protein
MHPTYETSACQLRGTDRKRLRKKHICNISVCVHSTHTQTGKIAKLQQFRHSATHKQFLFRIPISKQRSACWKISHFNLQCSFQPQLCTKGYTTHPQSPSSPSFPATKTHPPWLFAKVGSAPHTRPLPRRNIVDSWGDGSKNKRMSSSNFWENSDPCLFPANVDGSKESGLAHNS